MDVQSECVEPSAAPHGDLQPTGKINKAAFKLFGKRRTGSGMASFFSFRNKGASNSGICDNGNSVNGHGSASSVELVRSKTHDGLTSPSNDADGRRGEGTTGLEVGRVRSLSKSFSFFSLLRRGSFRSSENGASLQRRGRSLKGFFSSMRWRRKEKANGADGEDAESRKEMEEEVVVSEKVKDATLTLEPPPHRHQENSEQDQFQAAETPSTSVTMTPTHCVAMPGPSGEPDSPFTYTPTDSPLHPSVTKVKASISSLTPSLATPPLERCSTGDPPSEPTMDRLCSLLFNDATSLKSFDSLTGCGDIIADADEETTAGNGGSGTSSSSSGGGGNAGVNVGRPVGLTSTTSQSSPSKLPQVSHFTQPMFSTNSNSIPFSTRARIPPLPQQPPAGSGVVAYMGGGEEMASPEGVDDADMQGLWHMLPSSGNDSPALPRMNQPSTTTAMSTFPPRTCSNIPSSHIPSSSRSVDRKIPQVKSLGLSKIPVVGAAAGRGAKPPLPHAHASRHPTSPDKELLSDEGYWDTPTATPTATPDESGVQDNQNVGLSRDSCSGDHLYDFYNDPEEFGDDLNSTPSPSTEYKLSPGDLTTPPSSSSSSSYRSIKGSASLPRESKIPVSSRHTTPPHSSSQTALSSVVEAECPQPKTQAPPRSKIPMSKVPVRRSGNKPNTTTRGNTSKK